MAGETLSKVDKIKELFKEKRIADGSIDRDLLDRVHYQPFTGMNVFLQGNNIVFADLGKQAELSENMIDSIDEDGAIKFRLKDEDGPFKINIILRAL
jgi:hypothetical protein